MTSKEALEIAIKEVYKVLNGIDKRLNEGSLEFGDDYKYYNSPEEFKKALDKQSKYISTIEKLTSIKKDLDRLEKLEKVIQILKHHSFIEFYNYKRYGELEFFPVAIKEDIDHYFDYTIINVGSKENYNLLKEVLEND